MAQVTKQETKIFGVWLIGVEKAVVCDDVRNSLASDGIPFAITQCSGSITTNSIEKNVGGPIKIIFLESFANGNKNNGRGSILFCRTIITNNSICKGIIGSINDDADNNGVFSGTNDETFTYWLNNVEESFVDHVSNLSKTQIASFATEAVSGFFFI